MNVTGSFDHRIMDGAYGAQILAHIKSLLEEPILMVV
jgi:pyruvate dehydrogenase E2 component (dihydrolipoamide acetyltransferase)